MKFYFTNFWKKEVGGLKMFIPFSVNTYWNECGLFSEYLILFNFQLTIINFEFSCVWEGKKNPCYYKSNTTTG